MSIHIRPALLAAVALASGLVVGAARAGTVDVSFIEPEKFSDAGRGAYETEHTTQALAGIFRGYAKKLPEGQTLKVEVTDVDLAGELRWSRTRAAEIRVLRGRADWPRIELRFTLSENGRVIKQGESKVADLAYLQHSLTPYASENFAYEHRMLDQWFAQTFTAASAP